MDLKGITQVFDQFESQCEDADVKQKYVEDVMDSVSQFMYNIEHELNIYRLKYNIYYIISRQPLLSRQ